jgi:hypothetical protein
MEPRISLPCWKVLAAGPHLEPHESSPHPYIYYLLNIHLLLSSYPLIALEVVSSLQIVDHSVFTTAYRPTPEVHNASSLMGTGAYFYVGKGPKREPDNLHLCCAKIKNTSAKNLPPLLTHSWCDV